MKKYCFTPLVFAAMGFLFVQNLSAQDARFRLSGSGLSAIAFQPNARPGVLFAKEEPLAWSNNARTWRRMAVFADYSGSLSAAPDVTSVANLGNQQVWDSSELKDLTSGSGMLLLAHSSGDLYAIVAESGADPALYRKRAGVWSRSTPSALNTSGGDISFEACLTDDALHVAFYNSGNLSGYRVQYARVPLDNLAAATQRETVADIDGVTTGFDLYDFDDRIDENSHHARNLGIAAGADGTVHIIYSSGRSKNPIAGGTEVRSDLRMATKLPGGLWTSQELLSPGAGFGDYGGLGASIAMAPGGGIGVAANIIPRAQTGSPGRSYLVFAKFFRGQTPSWQLVDNTAAGYISGDGQQGTGLFPKLAFDAAGRAHIAYTDHASEHKPSAYSYSGQLRYARQNASLSGWEIFTPVSAGGVAPVDFQVYHPALAVRSDGTAAVAANVYRWTWGPPRGWQPSLFLEEITPQMQPPPPYVDPSPSTQGKKFKKKKSKPKSKPKAKAKQKKGKKK